jgi:V8-like Glu-specific endopeptidase
MSVALLLAGAAPQFAFAQSGTPVPAAPNHQLYLPALRAGTAQEPVDGDLVTAEVPQAEQDAVAAFWTRDKMLGAESLDLLVVSEDTDQAVDGLNDNVRPGPRGAIAPTLPDRKAQTLARARYAAEWARMEAADVALAETVLPVPSLDPALDPTLDPAAHDETYAYAAMPPFTSYYVNDNASTWKQFPWITMGRLFFQIPGQDGTYACTGAVAYGRAVWTAGHCVFTTGRGWSYNMYFVPAYRNGTYPYGAFTVKSRTALSQWVNSGNLAYDIGMVAVNDKSGMKLSQWVGSIGLMWNQSSSQLFHAFGYPGNYSAGQYLVACAASTYVRDPLPGPDPIGIGCDMGSGASGGPWIVGYAPFKGGATNYINGLVSYSYATKPLEIYGPYFGDGAKLIYDWGKTQ